jgi:hypothetical protein
MDVTITATIIATATATAAKQHQHEHGHERERELGPECTPRDRIAHGAFVTDDCRLFRWI